MVLLDPLLRVGSAGRALFLLMLLAPPLVSIRPLVVGGAWLAVWADVLLLAAEIACLLYNAGARSSGVGLLGSWTA
jgi:hypothetical protein